MTDVEYRVSVLAPPGGWLTANRERFRYTRARLVRDWRENTVAACTSARLPQGMPTPVRIVATIVWAGQRPPVRDRLNLAPTVKAVVDGLGPAVTITRGKRTYRTAGYGLLPDDSDQHVLDTTIALQRIGSIRELVNLNGAVGRVDLVITHHQEAPA